MSSMRSNYDVFVPLRLPALVSSIAQSETWAVTSTGAWGESLCYSWLAAISRIAGQACKGHSAPHPVPLLDAPHE